MDSAKNEETTTDDGVWFETAPIRLPDGWRGIVLTQCHGMAPKDAVQTGEARFRPNLPSPDRWHAFFAQITADPTALPGYTSLKYSGHSEVFKARLDSPRGSLDLIVKRTRARGLRRRLAHALRPSRERRNFSRALMLLEAGINTGVPMAVLGRGWPRREAWFIAEFVPDLVDLDQVVLRLLPQLERHRIHQIKAAIIEAIVDLLERMDGHNVSYRDLKASNIMLENVGGTGGPPSVWLVDLDGLHRPRSSSTVLRWRAVARLAASLLSYTSVTRTDYARFLKTYLARRGEPATSWRETFHELSRRATDYVRRARRRKTHKLDGYTGDE